MICFDFIQNLPSENIAQNLAQEIFSHSIPPSFLCTVQLVLHLETMKFSVTFLLVLASNAVLQLWAQNRGPTTSQKSAKTSDSVPCTFRLARDHNYYRFNNKRVVFSAAKNFCERRAAHVVQIKSNATNEFIRDYFPNKKIWMGMKDDVVDGDWRWVSGADDGKPVQSFWWRADYPSRFSADTNCANAYQGKWKDLYCDSQGYALCQITSTGESRVAIWTIYGWRFWIWLRRILLSGLFRKRGNLWPMQPLSDCSQDRIILRAGWWMDFPGFDEVNKSRQKRSLDSK